MIELIINVTITNIIIKVWDYDAAMYVAKASHHQVSRVETKLQRIIFEEKKNTSKTISDLFKVLCAL